MRYDNDRALWTQEEIQGIQGEKAVGWSRRALRPRSITLSPMWGWTFLCACAIMPARGQYGKDLGQADGGKA